MGFTVKQEKRVIMWRQMETALGICVHPPEFVVIDVKLTRFIVFLCIMKFIWMFND